MVQLMIEGKMSVEQKKLSRKLRQDFLKDSEDTFVTLSDSANILSLRVLVLD